MVRLRCLHPCLIFGLGLALQLQASVALAKAAGKAADKAAGKPPATAWVVDAWGHHDRPTQLDLSLGLWVDGLAPALWYAIPIAEDGLIQSVNDALDVEFGGMFAYGRGAFWRERADYSLVLSGGLRWDFYLTAAWTTFATLKLNFAFGLLGSEPLFFYPAVSVGGLYRLGKAVQLRLEAGNPFGLAAGLSFDL